VPVPTEAPGCSFLSVTLGQPGGGDSSRASKHLWLGLLLKQVWLCYFPRLWVPKESGQRVENTVALGLGSLGHLGLSQCEVVVLLLPFPQPPRQRVVGSQCCFLGCMQLHLRSRVLHTPQLGIQLAKGRQVLGLHFSSARGTAGLSQKVGPWEVCTLLWNQP
jgi:hypothetical protein